MLQGDRRHAGTPEDGVISREQIAQVLVTALSNDAAKNKTFELVAERGEAQQDLTPLFAELRNDNLQIKKEEAISDIRQLSNISFKTGIRYESTTNYCIIHGIHFGKYCICC